MVFWRRLFTKPCIAECGHETATEGTLTVNGHSISVAFNPKVHPPYCLACLERFSTNCEICKQPIIPGGYILKSPRPNKETGNNFTLIGECCMEMRCDATGKWTEQGYKDVPFEELYEVETL